MASFKISVVFQKLFACLSLTHCKFGIKFLKYITVSLVSLPRLIFINCRRKLSLLMGKRSNSTFGAILKCKIVQITVLLVYDFNIIESRCYAAFYFLQYYHQLHQFSC